MRERSNTHLLQLYMSGFIYYSCQDMYKHVCKQSRILSHLKSIMSENSPYIWFILMDTSYTTISLRFVANTIVIGYITAIRIIKSYTNAPMSTFSLQDSLSMTIKPLLITIWPIGTIWSLGTAGLLGT